ncbi:hypothetical protein EGW08_004364 [Elysia chlorotica]|uniref:Uncharacterized protein n=1 Tax=Elysia chlorotica TaxID=188477 RepID=A0A433U268_ELYCH|nr:hypothetical protein EGW08_004364 [Elysia chlorotica]
MSGLVKLSASGAVWDERSQWKDCSGQLGRVTSPVLRDAGHLKRYSNSGDNDDDNSDNGYNGKDDSDNGYIDRGNINNGYVDNRYSDSGNNDKGYSDNAYSGNRYSDSAETDNGYRGSNVPTLNTGRYTGSLDQRGFQAGVSDPGPPPKDAYAGEFSDNLYRPGVYREPEIATSVVGAEGDARELTSGEPSNVYTADNANGDVGDSNPNSLDLPGNLERPPPPDAYLERGVGQALDIARPAGESTSHSLSGTGGQSDSHSLSGTGGQSDSHMHSPQNQQLRNSEDNIGGFKNSYTDKSALQENDQAATQNPPDFTGISPTFNLSPTSLVIVPDENPLILQTMPDVEPKSFVSKGPQPFTRPR